MGSSYGEAMTQTQVPQFRRRRVRRLAAVVFAGGLALSACADVNGTDGNGTGDTGIPSTQTVTMTESPPPAAPGPTDPDPGNGNNNGNGNGNAEDPTAPMGEPDTDPEENMGSTGTDLDVSAIRLASHEGFDRVVFDIAGTGAPGWSVDYTDSPAQQGSGFPIEFEGETALRVSLHGLTQPVELDTVAGAGGVVTEVIPDINHHGTSQFIIGVEGTLPYSVTLLEEPTRLVIDILHG